MQLSSRQPYLSGALLVLLVASLLLWKNVASAPGCNPKGGHCELSLQELLDSAVDLSKNIIQLSTTLWYIFLRGSLNSKTSQEIPDVLLNVTLTMVGAWNNPLQHLVTEMSGMPSVPHAIGPFSLAKEIQKKNEELLDVIRMIQRKVHPGVQENENYPVWSKLASSQLIEENSRSHVLQNLVKCFYFDTYEISNNLNRLRCLTLQKNNC